LPLPGRLRSEVEGNISTWACGGRRSGGSPVPRRNLRDSDTGPPRSPQEPMPRLLSELAVTRATRCHFQAAESASAGGSSRCVALVLAILADKGYDTKDFVTSLREPGVTLHVAQNSKNRRSALHARTTGHGGLRDQPAVRKPVEEIFGWLKTVALFRKTRHRGVRWIGWLFTFAAAVYNLVRIRNVLSEQAA